MQNNVFRFSPRSHVEANVGRQEMIKLLFRSFKLAFHQENFSTNSFRIPATLAHIQAQDPSAMGGDARSDSHIMCACLL